jgi:hypothetical protein
LAFNFLVWREEKQILRFAQDDMCRWGRVLAAMILFYPTFRRTVQERVLVKGEGHVRNDHSSDYEIYIHGLRGHGFDRGGYGYCDDAFAMAAVDSVGMAALDSLAASASSALAAETPFPQPLYQDDHPR